MGKVNQSNTLTRCLNRYGIITETRWNQYIGNRLKCCASAKLNIM
jgi:hypothetical protein